MVFASPLNFIEREAFTDFYLHKFKIEKATTQALEDDINCTSPSIDCVLPIAFIRIIGLIRLAIVTLEKIYKKDESYLNHCLKKGRDFS